jgi:hypothetical protein
MVITQSRAQLASWLLPEAERSSLHGYYPKQSTARFMGFKKRNTYFSSIVNIKYASQFVGLFCYYLSIVQIHTYPNPTQTELYYNLANAVKHR